VWNFEPLDFQEASVKLNLGFGEARCRGWSPKKTPSNRRFKREEDMEGFIIPLAMVILVLGAAFFVYRQRGL
jgi:hypothetical protein